MSRNPRRPNSSPIRVEPGVERDTRTCKAFASTEDYTYSKTEDYKQRKALGMDTTHPNEVNNAPTTNSPIPDERDQKLQQAINKDLSKRNLKLQTPKTND